jgi:hypothetical protein
MPNLTIKQAWGETVETLLNGLAPTKEAETSCQELLAALQIRDDINAFSNIQVYKKGYVISWGEGNIGKCRYLEITVKNSGAIYPTANKSVKGIDDSVDWIRDKLSIHPYLDMGPGGNIDAYIISCGPNLSDIMGVYSKEAAMYLIEELRKQPHEAKYKAKDYTLLFISSNGLSQEII